MVTKLSSLRPFLLGLFMLNSTNAIIFGLYARRRNWFRKDFTYNKYHFGVFVQMAAAVGIAASGKLSNPVYPGILFMSSVALVSWPAYAEGLPEVHNNPDRVVDENGYMRRFGIYCLLGGWGVLFYKRRGSLPFLPPRLKNFL